MKTSRTWALAIAVALTLVGLTSEARADSITPVFTGVSGGFTWSYDALLSAGSKVVATDSFFTIYDFGGYTGGHSEPGNWGFSAALVTPTLQPIGPDDPALFNLTWTYSGPPASITGPFTFGPFTATSLYGGVTMDDYVWHDTNAANNGGQNGNGLIEVAQVPEPSSLLLMGAGLLVLALRRRS